VVSIPSFSQVHLHCMNGLKSPLRPELEKILTQLIVVDDMQIIVALKRQM